MGGGKWYLFPKGCLGQDRHQGFGLGPGQRRGGGRVPVDLAEDPVKKLFVGNLPFTCTEDRVREIFQEFGEIQAVTIPLDRESGKSRGFAFVEMTNDEDAEKAIAAVNGRKEAGRPLNVNEARPKEPRGGGGGGGRGGYRY